MIYEFLFVLLWLFSVLNICRFLYDGKFIFNKFHVIVGIITAYNIVVTPLSLFIYILFLPSSFVDFSLSYLLSNIIFCGILYISVKRNHK